MFDCASIRFKNVPLAELNDRVLLRAGRMGDGKIANFLVTTDHVQALTMNAQWLRLLLAV
jgi:hypothetical protein